MMVCVKESVVGCSGENGGLCCLCVYGFDEIWWGKVCKGREDGLGIDGEQKKKRKTHREGKNSEREEHHRGRGFAIWTDLSGFH